MSATSDESFTGNPGGHELEPPLTDAEIFRFFDNAEILGKLSSLRDKARRMDNALAESQPNTLHPLSRRFVQLAPVGNERFPFAHERVTVMPKSSSSALYDAEGFVVRYAYTPEPETTDDDAQAEDTPRTLNGVVVITLGLHSTHDASTLFLSPGKRAVINGPEDFEVNELAELVGTSSDNDETDVHRTLAAVLEDFEPIPQPKEL